MNHRTCEDPSNDRIPQELEDRLRRALDADPPRTGRLPVWVAAACLGAAVIAAPGCGKKEREADIPKPPAGLETALMKPDAAVMEPAGGDPGIESQDPMDPFPGQMDPPPGSMEPIPPPTRGADLRPGEEPPADTGLPLTGGGGMFDTSKPLLEGLGNNMGSGEGLSMTITVNTGVTYGAPPLSPMTAHPPPTVKENLVNTTGGKMDLAVIRRVIRQHLVDVRYCYERALQQKPTLAGKITAQFVIAKTGYVEVCKVQQHLDDRQVGDCLCSRLLRWRFPEPEDDRVVVTYTWTFLPSSP